MDMEQRYSNGMRYYKKMSEYNPLYSIIKQLFPAIVTASAILFGALAHAFDRIRNHGWKGWLSFFSDIIVCSFVGWVFFHAMLVISPDLAIVGCSIGSYWGTRGFAFVRDWFIESVTRIKVN